MLRKANAESGIEVTIMVGPPRPRVLLERAFFGSKDSEAEASLRRWMSSLVAARHRNLRPPPTVTKNATLARLRDLGRRKWSAPSRGNEREASETSGWQDRGLICAFLMAWIPP